MIPPDRSHLRALAGWALAARGNCSPDQHIALCHFQDGCGELSEVIEDLSVPSPRKQVIHTPPVVTADRPRVIPYEVQTLLGGVTDGPCSHVFNIRTQVCERCGLTYLKAHGHRPELF